MRIGGKDVVDFVLITLLPACSRPASNCVSFSMARDTMVQHRILFQNIPDPIVHSGYSLLFVHVYLDANSTTTTV